MIFEYSHRKHKFNLKFTRGHSARESRWYICIDSIINPKYSGSDLESGSKSQKYYFPRNDRFFCNDTPNDTSCEYSNNS